MREALADGRGFVYLSTTTPTSWTGPWFRQALKKPGYSHPFGTPSSPMAGSTSGCSKDVWNGVFTAARPTVRSTSLAADSTRRQGLKPRTPNWGGTFPRQSTKNAPAGIWSGRFGSGVFTPEDDYIAVIKRRGRRRTHFNLFHPNLSNSLNSLSLMIKYQT